MAKVRMTPIGSSAQQDENFERNRLGITQLNERIATLRAKCKVGWGEKYQKRVHQKGKLTTWERLEALKDEKSPIYPIGTFVNEGLIFEGEKESPSAGVLTVFVNIVTFRHELQSCSRPNNLLAGSVWVRSWNEAV